MDCHKCGEEAMTDNGGVIFVRTLSKTNMWGESPICTSCWKKTRE